jgi:putative nucleotidyltransferase with HDIG domain
VDVKSILKRESQLNLIAYLIILALIVVVGLLAFALLTGIQIPDVLPLTDYFVRTLIAGFLLGLVLYLADQHRRLRRQLMDSHDQLEQARADVQASYDRLAFAHHASTIMTSLDQEDGLSVVLREATKHFQADAAAVVGDEITIMTRTGDADADAQSSLVQVALEAVRAGKPLSTEATQTGGAAIAVPLRVRGRLQAVACMWRREGAFTDDQLEGLGLLARIIELSIENRQLLSTLQAQLEGTVETLGSLVDDLRPHYAEHALAVADVAERVGAVMGMTLQQQHDLRMAGLLHDIGLLRPSHEVSAMAILDGDSEAHARHAEEGAELARMANFSVDVQNAIMTHHETLDGSGGPNRLAASSIPVSGRILAVAEAYDTVTRTAYGGSTVDPQTALRDLEGSAGIKYDPQVLEAFRVALERRSPIQAVAVGVAARDPALDEHAASPAEPAAASRPSGPILRPDLRSPATPRQNRPRTPSRLGLDH